MAQVLARLSLSRKTKQAGINIERRKTGSRAQYSAVLTPEEQVLKLIPSSLTKGHAAETEVEFLDDDDDYNVIQASLATSSAMQATTETLNINYNDEDTENYDPSTLTKSKRSSSRQKVNEVKDSTRIITEVAEKTYLLKKKFCEEVVQCKKRTAKAQE
ncbi:phosphoglucosamine mutase [Lasius niger]|uniref:Phosphoglucosamine mutase n=1 Tax=Lasius niger TaxID=67767 RepID=A0A0J7KMJ9_LASNI|nr:phosphoglucosamine mutase [Lasius niger]